MKLRYWSLTLAAALLTYWALSHLIRPIWAVTVAVWVSTVAAFLGIVLTETNSSPAKAADDSSARTPTGEA